MTRTILNVVLIALCSLAPNSALAMPVTGNAGGGQPHTNQQPSLGMNHIIAVQGIFPPRNLIEGGSGERGLEPFLGEVSMFAGNFAPRGWMFAEGQALDIASNIALFSLLGTTYGGDGRTTFRLPDLRGRAVMHWGQGPGLTNRTIGQTVGEREHTLSVAEIPSHTHTLAGPPNLMTDTTGGGQAHNNIAPALGMTNAIALTGVFPSRNRSGGESGLEPFFGEVSTFAFNFAPRGWAKTDGQLLQISQNPTLFSLLGTIYGGDGRTTFGLPDLRGRVAMHQGQGPGLSNRRIGEKVGVEDVQLTLNQMSAHVHSLPSSQNTGSTGGGQVHDNMQPSLGLNYNIALEGVFPSRNLEADEGGSEGGSLPFIGEIRMSGFNFAPRGWAKADGQVLQISQNPDLFSLLGTTYGGDGRTTFGLPDLRGRIPVHPNGSSLRLGDRLGLEDVSLTLSQLPVHNHTLACDFDADGMCGLTDLNAMLSVGPVAPGVPAAGNLQFDLTGDGVIDNGDVDFWLALAGTANGFGSPYKRADANLDGTVDGLDFFAWNAHKFMSTLMWDKGDFNGDGVADGLDYFIWDANKFMSSDVTSVPEPSGWVLLVLGWVWFAHRNRT